MSVGPHFCVSSISVALQFCGFVNIDSEDSIRTSLHYVCSSLRSCIHRVIVPILTDFGIRSENQWIKSEIEGNSRIKTIVCTEAADDGGGEKRDVKFITLYTNW